MKENKTGTVALVIFQEPQKESTTQVQTPTLVEKLHDDREIAEFEAALEAGEANPLEYVYGMRERITKEEEEFGDYVENLLSQPFVRPDILDHGVEWFKSKLKIEKFKQAEKDATEIIANYAFKLYQENKGRTDFFLAGPTAKVRVRIFEVSHPPSLTMKKTA